MRALLRRHHKSGLQGPEQLVLLQDVIFLWGDRRKYTIFLRKLYLQYYYSFLPKCEERPATEHRVILG